MMGLDVKLKDSRVLGDPEDAVNILLVDDRPDGLLALEAVLACPEYTLVTASSGQEALSCMYDRTYAVVLLDVQMPIMDGFETARLMKQYEPSKDTPIIFVTAINKDSRHIYEGYKSGAADYLFKPFDPLILRAKVKIFVELFRRNLMIAKQAKQLLEAEKRERERRLAELEMESLQRYRKLADSIPHIICKARPDGSVDYVNEVWCAYTGLSREESSGEGWKNGIFPEDVPKAVAAWAEAVRTLKGFEIEIRIVRAGDGAPRWHLLRVIPETTQGKLSAWIGTCTDIHDRNEAWERLSKTNADLEQSNRDLEQFAYITSHDLQEPLRKILTFSDRLKAKLSGLDGQERDYFERMHSAAHRMKTIIEDLLQHSQIARGERVCTRIDLHEVLDEVMADLEVKIHQTGAQFEISALPHVNASRPQMGHLFQNLITNAIKFAKKDTTPHIVIAADRSPDGGVDIRVSDNGIGFEQKYVDRIFKPFQRLHPRGEYDGTGIGLSIVQKIVDNHGGRITALSQVGEGATFVVHLPDEPAASSVSTNGLS